MPTLLLHGSFETLSSFALVNRRLSAGLQGLGYRVTVMPRDGKRIIGPPIRNPDIYLAHDHPYDTLNAPGRLNVFLLEYEYTRILPRDRLLVERLNHFFDLVLAPSQFVREVCAQSGIRIPVVVCPLGVDPSEFHPGATPAALPTTKNFVFLYLGGANERKGTDILLSAFAEEFGAQDDAALVFKTFGYEHHRNAFERMLQLIRRRRNAPEIVHIHEQADSVAGYFTAANCGVFPYRGEGFALPILESLACGCPVIVTNGGPALEYCSPVNSLLIPAAPVTRHGTQKLEPDRASLQKLMRAAYNGKLAAATRQQISASVSAWTWDRTCAQIHNALQAHTPPPTIFQPAAPLRVAYSFYEKGVTSWKKTAHNIDRSLKRNFNYVSLGFRAPPPQYPLQVILGDSGFALEHFVRAARINPRVRRILVRGNGPIETVAAIENRERELCGVPPRAIEPLGFWREQREYALADKIAVHSRASARLFVKAGYPKHKLYILPLGISFQPTIETRRGRTLRFLYIASNPFRKGIRHLLAAWDALQPKHAELVLVAPKSLLESPLLLRYLVRNSNLTFKPWMSRAQLHHEYVNCDCQVLPSLEDGFSVAIGEGMGYGKPAIVSDQVGLSELIVHRENGYIVPAGSVTHLKRALAYFCDKRRLLPLMGEAAYETARQHSWARFERELVTLVQSQMPDA